MDRKYIKFVTGNNFVAYEMPAKLVAYNVLPFTTFYCLNGSVVTGFDKTIHLAAAAVVMFLLKHGFNFENRLSFQQILKFNLLICQNTFEYSALITAVVLITLTFLFSKVQSFKSFA